MFVFSPFNLSLLVPRNRARSSAFVVSLPFGYHLFAKCRSPYHRKTDLSP